MSDKKIGPGDMVSFNDRYGVIVFIKDGTAHIEVRSIISMEFSVIQVPESEIEKIGSKR